MIAFTRILVPTNLHEPSKGAVQYGVALARQCGAKLFVLHVLRDEDYEAAIEAERVLETLLPDGTRVGEPNPDDVARTVARADLQRILSREDEHDTRAEYLLRPAGIDGPSAAIADCAREMGVDLIVIGKHTIGRLEHLIAGSVTEKVLGQAPCPVMVVKHTGQERVPLEDLAESADA